VSRGDDLIFRVEGSGAGPAGLRGVAEVTAVTLVAEVGEFSRFRSPRQLMAYAGLVPREHSSGSRRSQGGITKTTWLPRAADCGGGGLVLQVPPGGQGGHPRTTGGTGPVRLGGLVESPGASAP